MTSRLAIIVINFKNPGDTIECLESLVRYALPRATIFLLDNASGDSSCEELQRWLDTSRARIENQVTLESSELEAWPGFPDDRPGIAFVRMKENTGFAGGNNFVLRRVLDAYDHFLLFNNDAVCVNDAVDMLRRAMDEHPEFGALTCRINSYAEPDRLQQMGGRLVWYGHFRRHDEDFLRSCQARGQRIVPVTFATGCVLMLRKDVLEHHGLLSERIFFGEEDVELCLRYRRAGVKIGSVIGALVRHKGGEAQKALSQNYVDAAYATSVVGRAVMLKAIYGSLRWRLWFKVFKALMATNIAIRRRFGVRRTAKIMKVIDKYVRRCDRVDRETYLSIVKEFA